VVFLATGKEKAEALYVTLAGPRQPVKLPAQRIHPGDGDLWWLVDGFAASLLPKELIDHSSEND
jgi:6-phosphogluconolactonase/glucosamine-6-phosphate isomerase/deaminase